jgi:hypothetical protein
MSNAVDLDDLADIVKQRESGLRGLHARHATRLFRFIVRAVSEESDCRVPSRAAASADDEARPVPVLQDEPRDHPPRGDALHPLPAHASIHNHFNQGRHLISRADFNRNRTAAAWSSFSDTAPGRFDAWMANEEAIHEARCF